MMRRYVRRVGSINGVALWIAIQTDEVPDEQVRAVGFRPVGNMDDAELRRRFGLRTVFTIHAKTTQALLRN